MEEKPLPPGQSVQPTPRVSTSTQMAATNAPVSSYSAAPRTYPIESLEVHQEGQTTVAPTYGPTMRSVPFSRRRATIVSLIITIVVILLTGLVSAFFINRSSERPASQVEVPTQDASLEDTIESDLPPELQGLENSLLVNGDVVTRGRLRVVSGSFTSNIGSATLTGNQTITLPNASGEVCLNANNCNFATVAQLNQIQPVGGVTTLNDLAGGVTIQGSLNQVTVATGDGVITLSTPQALDANANVQFSSLTLNGLGTGPLRVSNGSLIVGTINLGSADVTGTTAVTNGGTGANTLTANGVLLGNGQNPITAVTAGGSGLCLVSTVGAPTFQACPGGGGVSSVNSLTGDLTIQGTANQINVVSGGSTITLSTPQDIATTSDVTFNNLQLTGTADVNGVAAIGSDAVPDPDGKTALRVLHTVTTDCAFGCIGIASNVEFDTAGNPFFLTAFSGTIAVGDGRGLANSTGLAINNPLLGAGSTIQQNIGVGVAPQTSGNSNIGIVVGESTGTKQINLLLGITPDFTWTNVPAGSYSIYNASTDQNYFAGSLGIGDTTPAYALTVGNGDLFGVNSSGNVIVTALGAASSDTVVCRNASNQLATCNSTFATGSGTAFLQGGNNFGGTTAGTLGTINGGDLNLITTNLTRLTVQADGDVAFDTNTLFVDAANDLVSIGDITGSLGIVLDGTDAAYEDQPSLTFGPNSNKPWAFAIGPAGNSFELFAQGTRNAIFELGGGFWVCCETNGFAPFMSPTNTAGQPAFTFTNDADTGMYRAAANQLGFSTGGTNRLTISSTGGTFAQDVAVNGGDITSTAATLNINAGSTIALQDNTTLPNGLVGTPALSFAADTNTGIYNPDPTDGDQIGFSTGGVNTVTIGVDPGAAPFTSGILRIASTNIGTTEEFELYSQGTEDFEVGLGRGIGLFMNEATTGGDFIIWSEGNETFTVAGNGDVITRGGSVTFLDGFLRLGVDAFSIADGQEIVPGASFLEVTCTTGGGCTLTMDEDLSARGQTVRIVNVGANTITVNNASGSVELAGSAAWVGTQWSSLSLIYVEADGTTGRWVELARSVH